MNNIRLKFLGEVSSGSRRRPAVEELEQRALPSSGVSAVGIPEVSMLQWHRYTGPVATFHDSRLTGWAGNVTVTLNWGDGTHSEQTTDIRSLGHGTFQVWGTHEYDTSRATPYDMTALVKEKNGSSALTTSLFHIVSPVASLQLSPGTYLHGKPVAFKVTATQTSNNQPPTAFLMEYQSPGENTWHILSRGSWRGSTLPRAGGFVLSGTVSLPRGRINVRALATIGGVQYPSHSITITVE
jgi:hypothetical protein